MKRDEAAYLEKIGQRVNTLRKDRGWSQEEFAHRSGLHRTYISSLSTGQKKMNENG
jgi:transcriptional regulator with XRE-family HTH domain